MNALLNLLSKLALITALSGANAASSWNIYQPKLPKELE